MAHRPVRRCNHSHQGAHDCSYNFAADSVAGSAHCMCLVGRCCPVAGGPVLGGLPEGGQGAVHLEEGALQGCTPDCRYSGTGRTVAAVGRSVRTAAVSAGVGVAGSPGVAGAGPAPVAGTPCCTPLGYRVAEAAAGGCTETAPDCTPLPGVGNYPVGTGAAGTAAVPR